MKKCTSFEEQKDTRYIWGNGYFDIIFFSSFSSTKPCIEFLLICFAREIKAFIRFHEEVKLISLTWFPQKSRLKIKIFKKLKHYFVDERATISTTLISFCHRKTLAPFRMWKKRPGNAFLKLAVNCRKIMQENDFCHPKLQ